MKPYSMLKIQHVMIITAVMAFSTFFWLHVGQHFVYQNQDDRVQHPLINVDLNNVPKGHRYHKWSGDELSSVITQAELIRKPEGLLMSNSSQANLTVIVTCTQDGYEQRQTIRKTWGTWLREHGQNVFFIIGRSTPSPVPSKNPSIEAEHKQHDDIIEYDFVDDYYNLTLKTLFILRFFNEEVLNLRESARPLKDSISPQAPILSVAQKKQYSPAQRFLLKADDDLVISGPNFMQIIKNLQQNAQLSNDIGTILGQVHPAKKPMRDPLNKNFLPETLFPDPDLPDFTTGTAYMISSNAARSLYVTAVFAKKCPFITNEDVFMTGVCRSNAVKMMDDNTYIPEHRMDIKLLGHSDFKIVPRDWRADFCNYLSPSLALFGHGLSTSEMIQYWSMLNSSEKASEYCKHNLYSLDAPFHNSNSNNNNNNKKYSS
ncbi:lactosylceramide 1,3-N-acetyl-beta-D-glucosaminyltransferase-like [Brevipalpus obovatus]|uniref:lactosylceramide 1,3-N-acetyl-beta-D-glucosaminyltransferase-like n=1 Tax=Brevipalpus obovatus TaxID=246614 RepID=UPI003D9E8BD5